MIAAPSPRARAAFLAAPWLLVYLYAGLILAGSSLSAQQIGPLPFSGFDKLAHLFEYGLFSFLISRAMRREPLHGSLRSARAAALSAVLVAVAWGALDETYQRYTGRSSDVLDWVADGAGALLVQLGMLWGRGGA